MPAGRTSIAQVMAVVALAAVNLWVLRAAPREISSQPTIWIFLGAMDLLFVWKLILRRPLGAFHYTFLIVLIVAWIVMANLVVMKRFHPLGFLVRSYQWIASEDSRVLSLDVLAFGEFWATAVLCVSLAVLTGLAAAGLQRRRQWNIAGILRGALVGFGIANLLVVIDGAIWGRVVTSPARMVGRIVLLAVCVIVGGVVGRSRPGWPGPRVASRPRSASNRGDPVHPT